MYFVLNPEKNIIALDMQTLELFHAKNIMELYQKISNGFIEFYIKNNLLAIISATSSTQYEIEKINIIGLLGDNELIIIKKELALKQETSIVDENGNIVVENDSVLDSIEIDKIKQELKTIENLETIENIAEQKNKKEQDETKDQEETKEQDETKEIKDETLIETNKDSKPLEIEKTKLTIETKQPETQNESEEELNKELLMLLRDQKNDLEPEPDKKVETKSKEQIRQTVPVEPKIQIESSNLQIIKEDTKEDRKELEPQVASKTITSKVDDLVVVKNSSTPNINISTSTISKPTVENIVVKTQVKEPTGSIDVKVASELCGLSQNDYRGFFAEYIQTARKLKPEIMGNDFDAKNSAIEMIMHLSKTLHAPSSIVSLAEDIQKLSSQAKIENLYKLLDDIYSQLTKDNKQNTNNTISIDTKTSETSTLNIETKVPPVEINNQPPKVSISNSTINITPQNRDINLENVAPNRFDFSIEKSSEELSLPQDIIKDFMKDFAVQCRAETQNIITAYKEKDINKIERIAHSLKGVAGNLYLTSLAESILHLQHNTDINKVPELVEQYWAKFISFENQIKNM